MNNQFLACILMVIFLVLFTVALGLSINDWSVCVLTAPISILFALGAMELYED